MRRRLAKFLPIILIALAVQIFAPIGACWAVSIAASDPLSQVVICHGDAAGSAGQADQTGSQRAHDGCCAVCSVLHTGGPVDAPQVALAFTFEGQPKPVVWHQFRLDLAGSHTGFPAQARAPPFGS
ncbi:MAG TPA: DUF2946 family protein [Bradyrhizobium sp.]|nr:DUF2946 family protein [Bradyrhizobium sp.]